MQRAPLRLGLLAAAAALLAAGCGGAVADGPDVGVTSDTVAGIGRLPETIPGVTFGEELPVEVTLPPLEGEQIGTQVGGNRLLMVGDSIFAGVSRRYTNVACETLVPLDWQVLVEAEAGRFVEFGRKVLDRRLDEGWDAVAFMFGSNYRGDRQAFADTLSGMIADLGDVPVVLLTTSVFREVQREVNEVINGFGELLPNVTVVDWATISAYPAVLSRDRLHPTEAGQRVMMAAIAQVLGRAPQGPGDCLRSTFTDDSAVGPGSIAPAPRPVGTTAVPNRPSTSVASPGTSGPVVTVGPTVPATPAATQPPATEPPATSPPSTQPPATSPPVTAPPHTEPPPEPPGE